jgi:2-keto-3-deoxy-L-rhamnonate aldolase RhmA
MCSLGHYLPYYVRLAAHFQFDCIWFDMEHRAFDPREVQAMMAFFHLYDIDCMLRAPTLEKTKLYRYFEDGAAGLMIPHVSTEEKARLLVQSVKFPPLGDRGLDGASLDSDFILQGGPNYPDEANRETFLVVQIETPEAVANVERIAAVEGVDGLFVGPADLGLRIQHTPNLGYDLLEAERRVAAACEKHGKAWGRPASSAEHLRELTARGAKLVNHGGEFSAVLSMLETRSREWSEVLGE